MPLESSEGTAPAAIVRAPGDAYLIKMDNTVRSDGYSEPPELFPLNVHPALGALAVTALNASWPIDLPLYGNEFIAPGGDELGYVDTTARWVTYRCSAVLAHLATYREPAPEVARLLARDPFGWPENEVPDLTPLTDCLPLLSRMVLVPIATRARTILDPLYRADRAVDVATLLARHGVIDPDEVVRLPDDTDVTLAARARIRVAGVLAVLFMDPQAHRVHVPLALAYSAVATLADWLAAAAGNRVAAAPQDMRPLPIYQVAERVDWPPLPPGTAEDPRRPRGTWPPVPEWAKGLFHSPDDVEVWRG